MYVLLVHALISIIASIGSAHLFNRSWGEFIRRKREQQWIEPCFRYELSPLAFLSLAWGSITCGLLLIWITLLMHAVSFVMQLPQAVASTATRSGTSLL